MTPTLATVTPANIDSSLAFSPFVDVKTSDGAEHPEKEQAMNDLSEQEVTDRRIKYIFALAVVAAASSLAGQLQILGLSPVIGFGIAILVLCVAFAVAIPQLRRNFRSTT